MIIDQLSERVGGTPHYILATMVLEATTSAGKCIGEVSNKRIYRHKSHAIQKAINLNVLKKQIDVPLSTHQDQLALVVQEDLHAQDNILAFVPE